MNALVNFPTLLGAAAAASGLAVAVISLLRPRHTVSSWAFAAGMVVLAAESALIAVEAANLGTPARLLHWEKWRMAVVTLIPAVWGLFSLTFSRAVAPGLPRSRALAFAALLAGPLLFAVLLRHDVVRPLMVENRWLLRLGLSGMLIQGYVLIGAVLVLMNLERTYRASVGTMRWRIKFMLMGAGMIFLVRLYTSSQFLLFRGVDPSIESLNSGSLLLASLLFLRSLFRDGIFELDVYPSQTVLQSSLTVLLAGAYLVLVGISAKVAAFLGGDSAFAFKAFVALALLVALAVFLQSDRVRLRVRHFISQHFQRPLYDYRTAWKMFTDGTASRMEQTDLCRAVVRLVADIFQALSVTIWLVDEKKECLVLAASTSLSATTPAEPSTPKAAATEFLHYFRDHEEPVDFEEVAEDWAQTLKRLHPAEFISGGHRVCVPIKGRGEILGLLTLGDRVGGMPFTLQDFEMLKCACDHAAACLLNAQLSRSLLQAKELEAFQTMAAFFVHDLKNSASTLKLMLQNLPVHFDDPAFREDALRGIGATVRHIDNLIGRLGLLRHELKVRTTVASLNRTVEDALAGHEASAGYVLTKRLAPIPDFPFDPEQISKVVTNLVHNAREALKGTGEIRVETALVDRWATVTVTDTGCGMTPEFLARSLFRPFQTTKKSGLGIGMFQSKMIVEAHGGRITVRSEEGQGTTFEVALPTVR